MEIQFCDRCHESIPDPDFETGKAVRVDGRALHVQCAIRGAMPGPSRALTFGLAVVAAGLAAFAVARSFATPAPAAPAASDAPPAWQTALRDDIDLVKKQIAEARRQDQADIERLAGTLQARLDSATADLNGRLTEMGAESLRRFRANEKDVNEISQWVREVKDLATRVPPAAPANPEPVAPPAPPPMSPVEPPVPGPDATPTPTAPPVDPEVERRRDAEVDRWIERLKDREAGIAFSATVQLQRLGSLRAVPALVNTLKTHSDFYTRLGAATALGGLKAVDAVPALIDALEDKDDLVQTAASEALTQITAQDFKFVVGMPKKERKQIRDQWARWWKENETALRGRLNQPAKG